MSDNEIDLGRKLVGLSWFRKLPGMFFYRDDPELGLVDGFRAQHESNLTQASAEAGLVPNLRDKATVGAILFLFMEKRPEAMPVNMPRNMDSFGSYIAVAILGREGHAND